MCENPHNDAEQESQVELKKLPAGEFLIESGLLFQINRDILHPLGLALEVQQDPENGAMKIEHLWDCRDEAEGLIYAYETLLAGEKKLSRFMNEFGYDKIQERKEVLGYVQQTVYAMVLDKLAPVMNDFSQALNLIKSGQKLTRVSWKNSNRYVVYQAGYPDGIPINKNTAEATGLEEGTVCQFLPYLMHRVGDNQFVHYIPDMTDLLAEDWQIVTQ